MKLIAAKYTQFLILIGTILLHVSIGWSPRFTPHDACYKRLCKTRQRTTTTTTTTTILSTVTDESKSFKREIVFYGINRRETLQKTLTTLIGGVTACTALLSMSATTEAAHADVTNKVASSTALRALTRAQTQLPTKLLPDVKANNFVGVKARLREPPFDLVRKNGQILVRGGEDGPKAKELVRLYKEVISSLEKIDSTASLGMRGRTVDPFEMSQEYDVIATALDAFLKVGSEAADIPLQEQPSMQENLRIGSIETKILTSD